eukprot:TRINITY_DN2145_c0_g1_i2.p2 TRINITY_DN2145_c0_g1~~TRINITY_DN2145_c0_g1_i2.p2  ORF type:complete len:237 (+),score=59.26 TRINITY_DN2145_c0_g1_i2:74-784(+)
MSTGILDRVYQHHKAFKLALAFVVGGFLGGATSFIVNCTLIEISLNPFFSVYFGMLFTLIGGLFLCRVRSAGHPKPYVLVSFALLVLFSGILCFVLEKNWFSSIGAGAKIPLYSILGVSVTFALLFSIIDLLNYCCASWQGEGTKPLIETETQVYLLAASALAMGSVFGLIFGLLDVEDEKLGSLRVALLREQSICYPIGVVLGGLAACANQYLRENASEYRFDPLASDELDDEAV